MLVFNFSFIPVLYVAIMLLSLKWNKFGLFARVVAILFELGIEKMHKK